MKSVYLTGRQIAKIILKESANGDIRYRRYIYRLNRNPEMVKDTMEELASHKFMNSGELKKYLEEYIVF